MDIFEMRKFNITCNFGATQAPFTVYIGKPEAKHHPLHFQAEWLSKNRGGTIPQAVMDSIAKLKDIAVKNNVDFEELCAYALDVANIEKEQKEQANSNSSNDKSGKMLADEQKMIDNNSNT